MTYMQVTESKSHPLVNDIYAETHYNWERIGSQNQTQQSMTNMHLVNDKYAGD